MPSNNKRKHHGSPLHSSNGELPLASSADNRQEIEDISHRKHASHGKENSTVGEALPVARTFSNGVPAENSCHGETLARTSGDGIPAENSFRAETLISPGKSLNGNWKASSDSEYGGVHRGGTRFSTGKRVNGNSEHPCSSPGCARLGIHRHPHEDTVVIVNLKQLNKQLLEQVCLLRSDDALLHDKLKALQLQLEENTARGDVLLIKGNHGLESDLSDCEERVRETRGKLKESMKALALAEEKVQLVEADIDILRLNQHRLNGEISSLQLQNSEIQCVMQDLQIEKESVDEELRSLKDTCGIAEKQVIEANQVKEALEAKLAGRSLAREGFQMQLKGAWQQIQSLEAQQEASMSEKYNLEKQIEQLLYELASARAEHENTLCILKIESQEKLSLQSFLDSAEGMSTAVKAELNTRISSMAKLQIEADSSRQRIASLEDQMISMFNEKVVLEETMASLKEKLEHSKSSSEKAFVSSKNEINRLKESVSKLEVALAMAKSHSADKSACVRDLNSEVKELSINLKKRRGLAEVSVPLAAVSTGSLVVLSILYMWKRDK